jgi:hypothetical protein
MATAALGPARIVVQASRCKENIVSTRLGIELALDPAFTARAYRTRNIVCGQYGSWAAEMHMLRLSLVGYFQCAATVMDQLVNGAGRLAGDSLKRNPQFSIDCQGVAHGPSADANDIYLDFHQTDHNHPLTVLQREALTLINGLPGAVSPLTSGTSEPRVNLMEHADLPPTVMADALEIARGVAIDVGVPKVARAWRLVVLRYHSQAAGDDWSHGGWAPDLRWEYLSSYVI